MRPCPSPPRLATVLWIALLFASRADAEGNPLGPVPGEAHSHPVVLADGTGGAVVAYKTSGARIGAVRVDGSGAPSGLPLFDPAAVPFTIEGPQPTRATLSGAGRVLVAADRADAHGVVPLARVRGYASAGVEPAIMGTGPIAAVPKALARAGLKVEQLELVESNEAFAAQAIAVARSLRFDPAITNVSGGAIALGHPIGASGCRVLVTLVHAMRRLSRRLGLATLCIGGGQGIALVVERPS